MALVDPFIVPAPTKWLQDPETGPFVTYLTKFCHDVFQRVGAGTDLVSGAAQLTSNQTFSGVCTFTGGINLSGITLQVDGTSVVDVQQSSVADAAAATASNPSPPTPYTAHSSGGTTVTSNAATDLDTTAAALQTLVSEVTTYELAISALIVDVADIRTQLNALLAEIRDHGLIAT